VVEKLTVTGISETNSSRQYDPLLGDRHLIPLLFVHPVHDAPHRHPSARETR